MTIVVTGGGSGGHITPILAVARELKHLRPDTRIVYITHHGDSLDDVASSSKYVDEMFVVRAGKLRRYNGEGLRQLLDLPTTTANLRDMLWIVVGLWQSFWLLRKIRPAIIFTRGSYVSVPVTLAGALQGIPYVTHDSDAIPSLTNRLISKWATLHAVALPEELYPYPIDKTLTVGVPISEKYSLVSDTIQHQYKLELHLDSYKQVLLVTGGGLGAQRLNTAVVENAAFLLAKYPGMAIVHLTGRVNQEKVKEAYGMVLPAEALKRVLIQGFTDQMYRYSGAADVVIARGGATNLAELAVQGKTCIIVPNPQLTGGHQLKNTEALSRAGAIVEMDEEQIQQERRLASQVSDLIDNPAKARSLSQQLATFARPDAAERLARILLEKAKQPVADEVTTGL